ncbi:hypothetical protein L1887_54148 [Cichorium endivia]|nr:hypothetical protein L1887_54148 [Cichorium endivia]
MLDLQRGLEEKARRPGFVVRHPCSKGVVAPDGDGSGRMEEGIERAYQPRSSCGGFALGSLEFGRFTRTSSSRLCAGLSFALQEKSNGWVEERLGRPSLFACTKDRRLPRLPKRAALLGESAVQSPVASDQAAGTS